MIALAVWIVTIATVHLAIGGRASFPFTDSEEEIEGFSEVRVRPLPCGYEDLYSKFASGCKLSYFENIIRRDWKKGVITGKQLIAHLTDTCSHYHAWRKCANCTAKSECPVERAELVESVMEVWSVFCDKSHVAGWLMTILQDGYSFNTSSQYEVARPALGVCFDRLEESEYKYNRTAILLMSFSEGLDYFRTVMSMVFRCSMGESLAKWTMIPHRSTSWQDIVLTMWLDFASSFRSGLHITGEEIKMLQEIRC